MGRATRDDTLITCATVCALMTAAAHDAANLLLPLNTVTCVGGTIALDAQAGPRSLRLRACSAVVFKPHDVSQHVQPTLQNVCGYINSRTHVWHISNLHGT